VKAVLAFLGFFILDIISWPGYLCGKSVHNEYEILITLRKEINYKIKEHHLFQINITLLNNYIICNSTTLRFRQITVQELIYGVILKQIRL
jgi:hypothetical protein